MTREAIAMWWLGAEEGDEALLNPVERGLAREFGLPVLRHRGTGRPEHTFDPRRGQHSSSAVLRWLADRVPPAALKLIAVTDVDLFIPVLTFVYGEALLGGATAVVSTARLGEAQPALLAPRLLKTCVHELGHCFGLVHCDDGRCVMRRSSNLAGVDMKSAAFCPDCRVRLREALVFRENAS